MRRPSQNDLESWLANANILLLQRNVLLRRGACDTQKMFLLVMSLRWCFHVFLRFLSSRKARFQVAFNGNQIGGHRIFFTLLGLSMNGGECLKSCVGVIVCLVYIWVWVKKGYLKNR